MYLLNITDIAEEDILSVVNYITDVLKVPMAVNNLLDEIERQEGVLENTPEIYPFVSDEYLAKKGLKCVTIKNYILFYITDEYRKTVNVIRFLYGRKYWEAILRSNGKIDNSPPACAGGELSIFPFDLKIASQYFRPYKNRITFTVFLYSSVI